MADYVRGDEDDVDDLIDALNVELGYPREPDHRGSRCPPPPFGSTQSYTRKLRTSTGPGYAAKVNGRAVAAHGREVDVGGRPVTIDVSGRGPIPEEEFRPLPDAARPGGRRPRGGPADVGADERSTGP